MRENRKKTAGGSEKEIARERERDREKRILRLYRPTARKHG